MNYIELFNREEKRNIKIYKTGERKYCRGRSWITERKLVSSNLGNRIDWKKNRPVRRCAILAKSELIRKDRAFETLRPNKSVIKRRNLKTRAQGRVMKKLTRNSSASAYAKALVGDRRTSGIRFEWCHAIGRGAGGQDTPENLFAASSHANTYHLILESVLYSQPSYGRLKIVHSYQPYQGVGNPFYKGQPIYLAEYSVYNVTYDDQLIYSLAVNGFEHRKPSKKELDQIRYELQLQIAIAEGYEITPSSLSQNHF